MISSRDVYGAQTFKTPLLYLSSEGFNLSRNLPSVLGSELLHPLHRQLHRLRKEMSRAYESYPHAILLQQIPKSGQKGSRAWKALSADPC